MKKSRVTLWIVMVLVISMILPAFAMAAEEPVKITIVHTNDVHGNAEGNDDSKIGYPKLKTFVDAKREEGPVLLLDAGDVLHGTSFATISRGSSMVTMMNALGYDAMVAGNHDYNYGADRLAELAEEADFPILSGNVVKTDGTKVFDDAFIKEIDGVKVGIFGLTTPETRTKSNPKNTEGFEFVDEVELGNELVAQLKEDGAEVIVALIHLGIDEESDVRAEMIAEGVEGIDVIIDGHSHSLLEEGMEVNGVLIAQAGNHLENIGVVEIEVADGAVVSRKAELVHFEDVAELEDDAEIAAAIEASLENDRPFLEKVIGETKNDLDGEREHVRKGETNLGNLITDALLDVADAEVAITNGGGIRASIEAGDITMGDVLQAFPFANYPVLLEVSGADIVAALNHGSSAYPELAGSFPHVAGMSYKLDPEAPEGNKVFDVMVGEEPIELERNYKLVTNDFMAVGGDGYEMFADAQILKEFPLMSEALADFIEEKGVIEYEIEGRITEGEKEVEEGEVEEEAFADIKGHWAEETIRKAMEKGIMIGLSDTEFGPNEKMNRAMFVTVLGRIAEAGDDVAAEFPFSDVDGEAYYAPFLTWAVENEIIKGFEDETFRPQDEVTREQMAAIIQRYVEVSEAELEMAEEDVEFIDADAIAGWAEEDVKAIAKAGLIQGREDGSFDPKGVATRAEAATILIRLLGE